MRWLQCNCQTFDRIITIEFNHRLWSDASKTFASAMNFDAIHGNSCEMLPKVLVRFSGPALFWMEGYYRKGRRTTRGTCDAPVWDELRAIFERSVHGDRILIDNAHLFALGWFNRKYPSIVSLRKFVAAQRPNYKIEVLRDIVYIVPGTNE